jgi:hypothetical protein
LLFLDGTFLKAEYKGEMLVASTLDGNNNSLIVGAAFVDRENFNNWAWFLGQLKRCIPQELHQYIVVILTEKGNNEGSFRST